MKENIKKRRVLRELVNDYSTKKYISSFKLPLNSKCLELGAGTGSIACYLACRFLKGEVLAVDINEENIEFINETYGNIPNLKSEVSDVHTPCYIDEKFDLIHARFLMEHISDWEQVLKSLYENNLKEGGIIFFEDAVYSQKMGYFGGENYVNIMDTYSKIVSSDSLKWDCALQTPKYFEKVGLVDINTFGEIQTFMGNSIEAEYWIKCFSENREQLINNGIDALEIEKTLEELKIVGKCFSGPLVFHSYGKKERCIVNENDNSCCIKMVLTDCDGCLTNAGMYYTETGDEIKKFNTRDGMGVALLKKENILTGIITGEESRCVESRANKLGIDVLISSCKEKKKAIDDICIEYGIKYQNIAYIGDDINDIEALSVVGLSCCPSDAVDGVKSIVKYITNAKGGEGVFREVSELVLAINRINGSK